MPFFFWKNYYPLVLFWQGHWQPCTKNKYYYKNTVCLLFFIMTNSFRTPTSQIILTFELILLHRINKTNKQAIKIYIKVDWKRGKLHKTRQKHLHLPSPSNKLRRILLSVITEWNQLITAAVFLFFSFLPSLLSCLQQDWLRHKSGVHARRRKRWRREAGGGRGRKRRRWVRRRKKRAWTRCQLSEAEREGNERRHGDDSLGVADTRRAHTHTQTRWLKEEKKKKKKKQFAESISDP